jgi:hypothetical protein
VEDYLLCTTNWDMKPTMCQKQMDSGSYNNCGSQITAQMSKLDSVWDGFMLSFSDGSSQQSRINFRWYVVCWRGGEQS